MSRKNNVAVRKNDKEDDKDADRYREDKSDSCGGRKAI